MHTLSRIHSQRGVSIIGLMIGSLISMLCILTCMTMHKSLMQITVGSKTDAILDSQIASSLMQIQHNLHNAGLGMGVTTANDVVAEVDGSDVGLYWRYRNGGAFFCRGVLEQNYTDTASNTTGRKIVQVQATTDCNANSTLTDLEWTPTNTLAQFRNQSHQLFSFNVIQASCTPYGLSAAITDRLQVNVTTTSSAQLAGANVSAIQYQYCLPNAYTTAINPNAISS